MPLMLDLLIRAIKAHDQAEVLRLIRQDRGLVYLKDTTGQTPLHIAALMAPRSYNPQIVELLLEAGANPNALTSSGTLPQDYTYGKPKVTELLEDNREKPLLFCQKNNIDPATVPSFSSFARSLKSVMSADLYRDYLTEITRLSEVAPVEAPVTPAWADRIVGIGSPDNIHTVGETELAAVAQEKARKKERLTPKQLAAVRSGYLWSNVVSATDTANQEQIETQKVKEAVIKRFKQMGYNDNLDHLYAQCIAYLQENSVITVTFRADFLASGLGAYKLLNTFEKPSKGEEYMHSRDKAEIGLFTHLPSPLREQFKTGKTSRPCYGKLKLLDDRQVPDETDHFGYSFATLQQSFKSKGLYIAGSPVRYQSETGKSYIPCSWHNMDLVLFQCTGAMLWAILSRVTTGHLPRSFTQQIGGNGYGYCVEVLLPPGLNFLDPTVVESLHIASHEYMLKPEERDILEQQLKLTVTNTNPYRQLRISFMRAIVEDNTDEVARLLTQYSSLATISDFIGYLPLHVAANFGNTKVIALLINRYGTNPNSYAVGGLTALHIAIKSKKKEVIQVLCAHPNTDINLRDQEGQTPLMLAIREYQLDLINYLLTLPNIDLTDAVQTAIKYQHDDVLNMLLQHQEFKGFKLRAREKQAPQFCKFPAVHDTARSETYADAAQGIAAKYTSLVKLYYQRDDISLSSQEYFNKMLLRICTIMENIYQAPVDKGMIQMQIVAVLLDYLAKGLQPGNNKWKYSMFNSGLRRATDFLNTDQMTQLDTAADVAALWKNLEKLYAQGSTIKTDLDSCMKHSFWQQRKVIPGITEAEKTETNNSVNFIW